MFFVGFFIYELHTRLFLDLLVVLISPKNSSWSKHVEHLPLAQHSTTQSALHKAAKHIRADQSATKQGSRQSGREQSCRRESTARFFFLISIFVDFVFIRVM